MGKHYLYRHIRLDKNEPFYIGIGTKADNRNYKTFKSEYSRAFYKKKDRRNSFWISIIEKVNYEVEILLESNDYEFIKQKEREFILLYGRRDLGTGTLCNLNAGGDGGLMSDTTKEKIRKSHVGKTGLCGKDNPMFGKSGELNPNFGNKWSDEQREKARITQKSVNRNKGNNGRAEKTINIITLEIFDSAIEVTDIINESKSSFLAKINGLNYNDTPYMYLRDYNKKLPINDNCKNKYKLLFYINIIDKSWIGSCKEYSKVLRLPMHVAKHKITKNNDLISTKEYFYTLNDKIININTLQIFNSPIDLKNLTGLDENLIVKELYLNKTNLMYLSEYMEQNPSFKLP